MLERRRSVTVLEERQNASAVLHRKVSQSFEDIDTENQNKIVAALFDQQKNLFEADSEWAGLSRQLVLFEFFSGQKGATEVLRHLPLPGRYEGIVPLTETDTLYRH